MGTPFHIVRTGFSRAVGKIGMKRLRLQTPRSVRGNLAFSIKMSAVCYDLSHPIARIKLHGDEWV